MIIGIGTDIVETARIAETLEEHGDAFAEKVFTDAERAEVAGRKVKAPYYAGRWAAKEAVSKALGCGFGPKCSWKDIEILNDPVGKPVATLSGDAAETADGLAGNWKLHVTISHEKTHACATAIIESN
jgi:holo-[acyl-carrier protein] synthase